MKELQMSEIDEVEIDKQSIVLDDRLSNELYLKKQMKNCWKISPNNLAIIVPK